MAEVDFLADSQDNQTQEDLFDSPILEVENITENGIMKKLSEIVKEQKKLTEEVQKLSDKIDCASSPKQVKVEGSIIEKEFTFWLKEVFTKKPWIQFTEPDVQQVLKRLALKAGWNNNSHAFAALSSFASTKFTYFRNQTRTKLVANKEIDVEGLSIPELHALLWRHFLSPAQELRDNEREHLTLMLRSFCSSEKLFRKQHEEKGNFWAKFAVFHQKVLEDPRADKWIKLQEKEERRIRSYNQNK